MDLHQGDIIRITGYKNNFIIVSKNSFIRSTNVFHVCPILEDISGGPLHIQVQGNNKIKGTVLCEQIKLIDPTVRACNRVDRISYEILMNLSDAIQGVFEYD